MKKILVSVLSLVLILSLSACGKKTPVETTPTNNSAQTTNNTQPQAPTTQDTSSNTDKKEVTIEIEPPTGWTPVEGSVLPVQYMKETTSFMVKSEPYQSKDLDGVVEEAKSIFEGVFDEVKFIGDVESLEIDGRDAKKMVFSCTVMSLDMKYEYYFLFVKGKVYVITFGGLSTSLDSLSEDFAQIIKDIRFIE
jgi:predicted small lipoprotein YifL